MGEPSDTLDEKNRKVIQDEVVQRGWSTVGDFVVTDYIGVMITNRKSAKEITDELKDTLGVEINQDFIEWLEKVIQEISPTQPSSASRPNHKYDQQDASYPGDEHQKDGGEEGVGGYDQQEGGDNNDLNPDEEERLREGEQPDNLSEINNANNQQHHQNPQNISNQRRHPNQQFSSSRTSSSAGYGRQQRPNAPPLSGGEMLSNRKRDSDQMGGGQGDRYQRRPRLDQQSPLPGGGGQQRFPFDRNSPRPPNNVPFNMGPGQQGPQGPMPGQQFPHGMPFPPPGMMPNGPMPPFFPFQAPPFAMPQQFNPNNKPQNRNPRGNFNNNNRPHHQFGQQQQPGFPQHNMGGSSPSRGHNYNNNNRGNLNASQKLNPQQQQQTNPLSQQFNNNINNNNANNNQSSSYPKEPQDSAICKYATECTNPSCRFSHPSPVATKESGLVLSTENCEKQLACEDKDCPKAHVSKAQKDAPPAPNPSIRPPMPQMVPPPQMMPYVMPNVPHMAPTGIPCKFGVGCKRADCAYTHPWDRSGTACKFGKGCTRPDCYFWHPQGRRYGRNASVSFNQDGSVKASAEDEDPAKKLERSKRFNEGGNMSQRLEKFDTAEEDGEPERIIPGQGAEQTNDSTGNGDGEVNKTATSTTAE